MPPLAKSLDTLASLGSSQENPVGLCPAPSCSPPAKPLALGGAKAGIWVALVEPWGSRLVSRKAPALSHGADDPALKLPVVQSKELRGRQRLR